MMWSIYFIFVIYTRINTFPFWGKGLPYIDIEYGLLIVKKRCWLQNKLAVRLGKDPLRSAEKQVGFMESKSFVEWTQQSVGRWEENNCTMPSELCLDILMHIFLDYGRI